MQAGMVAEGAGILADIRNFTDVRAEVQVNKVLR
jgi:hypothetical protein